MTPRPAQSATRRRAEEQAAALDALPPGAAVTAIRPAGDDRSRFVIRAGRARFGPIHAADLDTPAFSPGSLLDGPARDRLAGALLREAARTDALALLRTRARSSRDLAHRLGRKGHDRESAAAAVERLARVGLIDDAALARDRAETLAGSGAAGPRAAEVKLRTLGIDANTAAAAVREAFAETDLLGQASDLARRRARAFPANLDAQARRRRLFGYLARRGYDHDTCRQATERALGTPNDD